MVARSIKQIAPGQGARAVANRLDVLFAFRMASVLVGGHPYPKKGCESHRRLRQASLENMFTIVTLLGNRGERGGPGGAG